MGWKKYIMMNQISNGVKKILLISLIFCIILPNIARSETALSGRILLQVEDNGHALHISPSY